jgi:hypothetical protein
METTDTLALIERTAKRGRLDKTKFIQLMAEYGSGIPNVLSVENSVKNNINKVTVDHIASIVHNAGI